MTNRHRTLFRRILAVVLFALIALPLTATLAEEGIPPQGYQAAQSGVTLTTNVALKIREYAGTRYQQLGSIPAGTTVPVIGRVYDNSWVFIEYNGIRGWVAAWLGTISGDLNSVPETDERGSSGATQAPPSESPAPSETPPPTGGGSVTATAKSNLRIRQGPGTNHSTIGTLPAGASAPVQGRNGDNSWVLVSYNGVTGWIAAWLSTISGDLSSVPVSSQSGSAPAPPPSAPPPSSAGGFELGGQTQSFEHPAQMRYAGMTWVKFQHKWSPGQSPLDVKGRIDQAHALGFRVLLSIPGTDHPSSIDYAAYIEFVRGVAALGADGIEVWNEMNLDREWPAGQIDPAIYVNRMLAPAYAAIKSANPGTLVIAGALAPTGVHTGVTVWRDDLYLAGMRDAGAARYMDCLGVHHNAGATPPDAVSGHPADGGAHHYSWYFPLTFNLYAGTFPSSKLCFTELGYLSPQGYGQAPPNFWWGGNTTVAQHAAWLARAVEISRNTGRVRLLIIFNVDFTYYGDDPQAGYAMIRPDGSCPACETVRKVMFP